MAYAEKRGKSKYPWRVKFRKPDGSEGSASGFRTRQDALNHGNEQEADIRRRRWRDPSQGSITLDQYWAEWYPLQVRRWSDSTQDWKQGLYRNHIKPRWGAVPLNEIDPIDIEKLEVSLQTAGHVPTATGVMILLRTMLADAVAHQRLEVSPIRPKRRGGGKPIGSAPRKGIVTTLARIEAICERLRPQDRLMVITALFTGFRWGEVTGMRRSFLHLEKAASGKPASGYYTLDPDVGSVKGKRRRRFGTTKTYAGRDVELPPFLVELLLEWTATLPEGQDLLFATRTNRPLDASTWQARWWRPACDGRPGVPSRQGRKATEEWEPIEPGLWFHDLRRTHKTWLAEDGIEKAARDERLGHVSEGMDGVYIQPTARMRAKVLRTLQRRWEQEHPPSRSPKRLPDERQRSRSTAET